MSREYMEHLKDPTFVANSILQHRRIQIIDALKIQMYEDSARKYVIALINLEFEKAGFVAEGSPAGITAGDPTAHKPYSTKDYYTNIMKKKKTD
jgi:hypothetical protein